MLLSINQIDLESVPFSRRSSYMMFLSETRKDETGNEQKIIYFAFSNGLSRGITRYDLIRVDPLFQGQILPFTYTASPGLLTMETLAGKIEICFDGGTTVLFRTSGGLGLRFFIKYQSHENFLDRLDGTVYASFKYIGEFLFECTHGSLTHNGKWNGPKMMPEPNHVDYLAGDGGRAEGYIHFEQSSVDRPDHINPFDSCVQETREDYEKWCKKYPEVPEKYAGARLLAIYVIWINYAAPMGQIHGDIEYMMRCGNLVRAMGWHAGYQAMAACLDIGTVVKLLYSLFRYQDEYGQIPDGVNDVFCDMHCTKPPFQGFAFEYIVNHGGLDQFTREHCELLYEPFKKWLSWWQNFRDIDSNGLIDYVHADESGWDDSSVFHRGMPIETPDIHAFLILLMEALSKMAGKLGMRAEAEEWMARSRELLETTIRTFWNGEKFIARLVGSREIVDTETIAMYQPIILGKRLPREIIDKLAARIDNEETFLTEGGLTSESKKSPFYTIGTAFMLGRVLAPVQLMMAVGFFNAGKKQLAGKIAAAFCDYVLEKGLITLKRQEDLPVNEPNAIVPPPIPGNAFSSWGASVFLVLSRLLVECNTPDN